MINKFFIQSKNQLVFGVWKCQNCFRMYCGKKQQPAISARSCITYLGKPKNKKNIVHATYCYCDNCK